MLDALDVVELMDEPESLLSCVTIPLSPALFDCCDVPLFEPFELPALDGESAELGEYLVRSSELDILMCLRLDAVSFHNKRNQSVPINNLHRSNKNVTDLS